LRKLYPVTKNDRLKKIRSQKRRSPDRYLPSSLQQDRHPRRRHYDQNDYPGDLSCPHG
jgi:hypothetical protein